MKVPWSDDDEVVTLRQEVRELRQRIDRLEARLDDRFDRLSERSTRQKKSPRLSPDLVALEAWVAEWFGERLERRVSNTKRWCPQWYNHPEVVTRLWVLYNAHRETEAYDDAMGLSTWYVDHLDKHLDVLLSADGPFAGCSAQRHSPARGLDVRQVFKRLAEGDALPAGPAPVPATTDNSPTQQQPVLSQPPPRR